MANSGLKGEWKRTSWGPSLLPVIGWKIWYGDGSICHSGMCSWADAPREGVQVTRLYHGGRYSTIADGSDEYTLPGETETKLGEEIDLDVYAGILKTAKADDWRPQQ
jgi:hypothetical protein